ncbi:ATP-grasp domain-containing protein [Aeoliella sp.]|uniref:ATP-grasp domain-containing protein n=1 Tax=Aeoliella sp. TaxID=2795800 RepID=UPI003CCC4239
MRLAIIGASARAAAFSALAAGYEVVAADLFADSDLAARCPASKLSSPGEFVQWLAEQQIDGWLATGAWENYPEAVQQMIKLRPMLGCSPQAMRMAKDPQHLASLLAAGGVAFPEIAFTPPNKTGWLVKAMNSAGGLGVDDWQPGSEPPKHGYWQRKIEGTPISATYVAAGGRAVLLGATEQLIDRPWTRSDPYHYAGSVGPFEVPGEGTLTAQLMQTGELLTKDLGLVGLFGVDFVLDPHGTAWAVDVNPRYTASMEVVERFTGASMVAVHVAASMQGVLPNSAAKPSGFAGKAYLFAEREVTFRVPPNLHLADIPFEEEVIPRGYPICTLLATAEKYAGVEQRLRQDAQHLESWLFSDEV